VVNTDRLFFASEECVGALNLVNGEAIPDEFLKSKTSDVSGKCFLQAMPMNAINAKLSDKLSVSISCVGTTTITAN